MRVVICLTLLSSAPLAAQSIVADTARPRRIADIEVKASPIGRGRAQAAASVDRTVLQSAPGGTNPLRALARIAGANVQTSDAFGQYEWANRITMRGFQSQQIGQTLDGLTLGDLSYGNFNGLGLVRAVDPDNVATVEVLQGSAALGTASSNSLGGVVEYRTADPLNRAEVTLKQLTGSAAARRSSVRVESGLGSLVGGVLAKGYISLSRLDSDKWKGTGVRFSAFPYGGQLLFGQGGLFGARHNWRDQLNAKGVLLAGAQRITLFYDYADGKEHGYADLSLDRWRTAGREFDQYSTWAEAQAGATGTDRDAAYFHGSQGARRNHLAYLRGDLVIGRVTAEVTPYLHIDRGAGDWFAPSYGSALYPDPIMFRQTQYASERQGVTTRVRVPIGGTTLESGVWLERNVADQRRPRFRLRDYATGPEIDFTNVLRLDFDRTARLTTTTAYLRHEVQALEGRLRINYGAKWLRLGAQFLNNGNTPTNGIVATTFGDEGRPDLSVPTRSGLLPQVGAVLQAGGDVELYANVAENVNALPYNPATGIYGTSPAGFASFASTVRPERARTVESGIRVQGRRVAASLGLYRIGYANRLVPLTVCPATTTCNASYANVGSVTSRGAEAMLSWAPRAWLSAWTSAAWGAATYDDDYIGNQQTGDLVPARGQDVVDAPRLLVGGGFRLARRGFWLDAVGRYASSRALSIVNDVLVPGAFVADVSAGWRAYRVLGLRELAVHLNVQNAFDADYIATIGTIGFAARGGSATATVNPGVPRQLFAGVTLTP